MAWVTSNGLYLEVSIEDLDLLEEHRARWRLAGKGYPARSTGKHRCEYLHRVVLSRMLGRPLRRREWCDHINGNPLDSRRENLRVCDPSENLRNQRCRRKTLYKGLHKKRGRRHWSAMIGVEGQSIHLGCFLDPEDAALVYDAAAREFYGPFARLNFPCEGEQQA